ncbi:arylamine n-acetyltransferase [Teratosphaeria destructans]|uniref:Arylamine n-acetyltransferase n=1 Tax=Teratosphaeria destructans TaxID=418781 RepID=A0A9W7SJH9_9PEZI|nr:arylamine n-acetyltransferase [Teratosphaeria destructans]
MAHAPASARLTQLPIDTKNRPRYSKDQLQTYFKRIKIPQKYLDVPIVSDQSLARTRKHGLPFLRSLTRYHVCNVPFENLELHYSVHKTISLDMDDLYNKFVQQGLEYGRGGRCMENNGFFGTVLRSLGFDVRNCGGRVSRMMAASHETRELQGQTYDPWNHMLNLVRLDDRWYVVDVGMGAMGPNIVYPLEDGYEAESIAPRRIRLQRRCIPEHAAEQEEDAQKLWCFDVCFKPDISDSSKNEWVPTYCFTETEFLPQDYEMMSWWTSTSPKSFFTYVLLCTKMIQDEESEKIIGDVSLVGNSVKRKTAPGQRDVIRELRSEQVRIKAIKDIFGIELTPEEQAAISPAMRIQ